MARCIIHPGMPHTNVKSIQYSLMKLDDADFLYAPLTDLAGFPNHSAALRNLYTPPGDPRYAALANRFGTEQFAAIVEASKQSMQRAFDAAAGRTLVFSAEGITRMSVAALKRLKSGLSHYASDISIVAYVSTPHAHAESVFEQRVRDGQDEQRLLETAWPAYRSTFARLDTVFGAENVSLAKYDPPQFEGGDVVSDFCRRLGIKAGSIQPVRRSEGLTLTAARLFHQYGLAVREGRAKPMGPALADALADRLKELDSTPLRLAPEFLASLTARVDADIAWMEERLGQSLAEPAPAGGVSISSVEELAAPVEHAAERLAALVAAEGGPVAEEKQDDVAALMSALAGLAMRKRNASEGKKTAAGGGKRQPAKKEPAQPLPYNNMAQSAPRKLPPSPLTGSPAPLINQDKNLVVLWSPKSACTTVYVWFSHLSGFSGDVRNYANWPHKHRVEQYQKSDLHYRSAQSGMPGAKVLKIIREPYGRAVSIYRHALQTRFADVEMEQWSGGKVSAEDGYSFQTFLDLLESLNMSKVDIHFRPQFHPLEKERGIDRLINISSSDLFKELNAFEEEAGFPVTQFEELNWLHSLESKRKAKQDPMPGDALDEVPFSRVQVRTLGKFPSYPQLLTPRAKQRIEAIYKADFEAYGKYL